MRSKTKKAKQPELVEPVNISLSAASWRHLSRVLVYSGKSAPGMRDQLITLGAQIMKSCEGKPDSETVLIREARTTWCNLVSSLLRTNLCLEIGKEINQQIPI